MINWKAKLTSRKLWAAVSAFASELLYLFGMAEGQVERIVALIMAAATMIAYIVAEGLVDAKATDIPLVTIPAEEVKPTEGETE